MIRVCATGDWHISVHKRFKEHVDVLFSIIEKAKERNVDLFLFTGDYGLNAPHRLNPTELNTLIDIFQLAASIADVVAIPGNHDWHVQLEVLKKIKNPRFHYFDEPAFLDLGYCTVTCMPWMPKTYFLDEVGVESGQAENVIISDKISSIIKETNKNDGSKPSILTAHYSTESAKMGQLFISTVHDICLKKEIVNDPSFDLITLGHLHTEQQVGKAAWYSGSPVKLNFSETEDKSFNYYQIEEGGFEEMNPPGTSSSLGIFRKPKLYSKESVPLESWGMVVLKIKYEELATLDWRTMNACYEPKNAYYRVDIELPEGAHRELFDFSELEKTIMDLGARSVKIVAKAAERDSSITPTAMDKVTDEDRIAAILEERGVDAERRHRILSLYTEVRGASA